MTIKELGNVVASNIEEIENQIQELSGALNLSRVICSRKDGIVKYEKHLILNYFGLENSDGSVNTSGKKATFTICAYIFAGGMLFMLFSLFDSGSLSFAKFKEGVMIPFWWFIIASVVGLPLFFIGKRYPKLAAGIKKCIMTAAGIITVMLLGLAAYLKFR